MNFFYRVFVPSGNNTALLFSKLNDLDKKCINDEILSSNNSIEQVGFISVGDKNSNLSDFSKFVEELEFCYRNKIYDNKLLHIFFKNNFKNIIFTLSMAGGEQCINALRCAAFVILKTLNINSVIISHCGDNFLCDIKDNLVGANIFTNEPVEMLEDNLFVVRLSGITHFVSFLNLNYNKSDLIFKAKSIFSKYNSQILTKAVGFIGFNGILNPIVLVKDINTLFFETSCGSGTIALIKVFGFLQANGIENIYLHNKNIFLNKIFTIKQPSGENLFVKICNNYDNLKIYADIKEIDE